MNKELLSKVADAIESCPEGYSQQNWGIEVSPETFNDNEEDTWILQPYSCDSPSCICGWALYCYDEEYGATEKHGPVAYHPSFTEESPYSSVGERAFVEEAEVVLEMWEPEEKVLWEWLVFDKWPKRWLIQSREGVPLEFCDTWQAVPATWGSEIFQPNADQAAKILRNLIRNGFSNIRLEEWAS